MDKKEITIYYPPQKWLESEASQLDRINNKYALENKYSGVMSILRNSGVKVNLKSCDEKGTLADLQHAQKLMRLFLSDTSSKIKKDWARLVTLLDSDPRNIIEILDFAISRSAQSMLHDLVRRHVLPIKKAWNDLGNTKELKFDRHFYGYYFYESDLPTQWRQSALTKNLNLAVQYATGMTRADGKNNPYRADNTILLLPKSELVIWDFIKRYGEEDSLIPVAEIEKDLLIYQGSDFIAQIPIFEGLKTAGIIKAGATKVPQSVAKKIDSLMTLKRLPILDYVIFDRCDILANLGAYAEIESNPRNLPLDKMAQIYLKAMFEEIKFRSEKSVKYLLQETAPKLSKRCLDTILINGNKMPKIVASILNRLPATKDGDGQWVRYENLIDWILFAEANHNSRINWLESDYSVIELGYDDYLYPEDFFDRLKLPVIAGLLQMLASIGLIDYAFDDDDGGFSETIHYVRITNAGLWIANRVKTLKVEVEKVDDGLHFDPDSLMITIRDTNSPNIALLDDLTEKVTPNRYKITAKALLRTCHNLEELSARIDRLKNYLLGGVESANLSILTSRLYVNYNKVKPADNVDYYCFDIDPEDENLHAFLIGNEQIRKNSLRVEGWKLLVKKSYYSVFLERLRNAGYLTEY